jgi:hypothetical protein
MSKRKQRVKNLPRHFSNPVILGQVGKKVTETVFPLPSFILSISPSLFLYSNTNTITGTGTGTNAR